MNYFDSILLYGSVCLRQKIMSMEAHSGENEKTRTTSEAKVQTSLDKTFVENGDKSVDNTIAKGSTKQSCC